MVDLETLAQDGLLEELEAAWLEKLQEAPSADSFCRAFQVLPDNRAKLSLVPSMQLLLESCQERNAHADSVAVLRALAPFQRRAEALPAAARRTFGAVDEEQPWRDLFFRLSGLLDDACDFETAFARYRKLRRLLPGRAVYHRSGWGDGVIVEHDLPREEFSVRFREDCAVRPMPFTTGLDVLLVLKASDLRARRLTDLEDLQREAAEDPSALLRSVARLTKGRATLREIKQYLEGDVIPTKSWASWWRKAKAAALEDPFLSVENPARPVFILRQRALSPEEELTTKLNRARKLSELLAVARGPLGLDPPEALRTLMLDAIASMAVGSDETAARLEAALVLVRHGAQPADHAQSVLREMLDQGVRFADLARGLPSASLRKEAFDLLVVLRGDLWEEEIMGALGELAPQLLDVVADRLVADGRGKALAQRFRVFLMAPSRQPWAVLRLARRAVAGAFDGIEDAPSLADVFLGVIHLAETQAPLAKRGDKEAKEIMRGVEELLVTRTKLTEHFVTKGTRSELEFALAVLKRTRGMPDLLADGLPPRFGERFADLAPMADVPFWQRPGILCSRNGILRHEEELRVLLEEKIPENRESIGKAAAYGDLSENFEWAAAIEQQRQLTERVAQIQAELKVALPIEDQEAVDGVVAPGMRVTYTEDGETKTITILGPWDRGDDVVSYRAPVAAGMLGGRAGEEALLQLPAGDVRVTINEVVPALG